MKAFLKWLLDVVSVLLGIAGFYWLSILLGRGLGNSGTEGLLSRYSNYLFMIGLPAALSVKPVYLATYNIHQSKKSCEMYTRPKAIGTARESIGQCGDAAQKALQLMLVRLKQTTCPHLEGVLQ